VEAEERGVGEAEGTSVDARGFEPLNSNS